MLTIEIVNDGTGKQTAANYDYRVLVNGREIASGRVEGHDRTLGWPLLVRKLADQAERERVLKTYMEIARLIQERDAAEGEGESVEVAPFVLSRNDKT